jgi:ACDE family multidrug resistance protein
LKSTAETDRSMAPGERPGNKGSIWRQPKAIWAVAFACVIAFMGLGLVDPILPAIAKQLHATPSQVELLFSSYFLLTGVSMIVTGVVSSRLGHKRTLLGGLGLIVLFSALAGSSGTIAEIVGFRAGWGLGNALFIATALAVIVEVSNAGTEKAVVLYEAALGLGISVGPLLGGLLGGGKLAGPVLWRRGAHAPRIRLHPGSAAVHSPGRTQELHPRPFAGPQEPWAPDAGAYRALLQLRLLHDARLHPLPA